MSISKIIDVIMIVLAALGMFHACFIMESHPWRHALIIVYCGLILIGIIDLIRKWRQDLAMRGRSIPMRELLYELILLDEDDREIKRWDIRDKVSLVIGRNQKELSVDIDLTDSEYGALVDYQHAVLNYTAGNWYIEDLYSKNGVRIRKQQDGVCYQMAKDRPCKLSSGDVILIANTKLLFR